MVHTFRCVVGGRVLTIESGKLAEQANGAVTVHYGDTVVLVTACANSQPRDNIGFFPLTVDYEERLYAAGKIPGGYIKREGRPSQEAVLASRLTDRTIRPLFPKGFRNDVQIVVTVLSTDQENDPDILAIIGASAALGISGVPFEGPVSACRVGYVDGGIVLNPTFTQLQQSDLDLVVAGISEAVVMVEAGARQIPESLVVEAIRLGQETNRDIIRLQQELIHACGRPKMEFEAEKVNPELETAVAAVLDDRLAGLVGIDRAQREEVVATLKKELVDKLSDSFAEKEIVSAFETRLKAEVRASILGKGVRPGGRDLEVLRSITCGVGVLPRTHGSGLFTRGETQVLTITTLGSASEGQRIDGITQEESKRFMHHYNFPPFSTGEVGRLGSPGRREIGHGALVERALAPVIPSEEDFPYTIRLVSEVLSSNGSTSMASACASALSLMDAGVPIKTPVAGVAMGLVMGQDGKYAILTDIEGIEDALGDMDFKVAGTDQGITAMQMDIKVKGITHEIMENALSQARKARLFVLGRMAETISVNRPELSQYAPRMIRMTVSSDKIGSIIGPGGRTIRSIIEETKATIDIDDDGTVFIGSPNEEAARKAAQIIEGLTKEVEVGAIYTGKVTRVTNFGAFVEILPGKEGLVHISELADYRVPSVEDVVKVGDEIMVMVTEIDRQGRINLSRRAVFKGAPEASEPKATQLQSLTPEYPFRRRQEPHPGRLPGKGIELDSRRLDEERRVKGPLPRYPGKR